jgi:protein TonB
VRRSWPSSSRLRSSQAARHRQSRSRRDRQTHPLGIEPSLWVALGVSVVVHATVLATLAERRESAGPRWFAVALYAGGGAGGSYGLGDGSGQGESRADGEARAERHEKEPPAQAVRSPAPLPVQAVPETRTAPAAPRRPLGERRAERASPVRPKSPVSGGGGGLGGGRGSGAGRGAGGYLQGSCLACPPPEYPRQARRHGWQGVVDLRLQIDTAGRVATVGVERSSGFKVLDDAAVAAARRSRFRIRALEGAAAWGRMRYRFEIGDG